MFIQLAKNNITHIPGNQTLIEVRPALYLPTSIQLLHYVIGWGDIRSKSERFLATQTPAAKRPRLTSRFLNKRHIKQWINIIIYNKMIFMNKVTGDNTIIHYFTELVPRWLLQFVCWGVLLWGCPTPQRITKCVPNITKTCSFEFDVMFAMTAEQLAKGCSYRYIQGQSMHMFSKIASYNVNV